MLSKSIVRGCRIDMNWVKQITGLAGHISRAGLIKNDLELLEKGMF